MGKNNGKGVERRNIETEFRVDEADGKLHGTAAVFNSWSQDLGGFREIVRPGAFKKTIGEADVRALFNHDPNFVLGRTGNGTLELREDKKGLQVEIEPPDTAWARDLVTSIRRGDISQMSFGFQVVKEKWLDDGEDEEADAGPFKIRSRRELLEVRLFDVSPVTFPAYTQTEVQVRSEILGDGVDETAIASVLFKAHRALPLSDPEKQLLAHYISALTDILPDEPEQGLHSSVTDDEHDQQGLAAARQRSLDIRRRQHAVLGVEHDRHRGNPGSPARAPEPVDRAEVPQR